MDGLKLTCEFTFNKKEKKETFKLQCGGALLSMFFTLNFLSQRLPIKNGHCGFKKLNCPLACAERCDWWAWLVPLETELETGADSSQCVGALSLSGFHSEK